MSILFRLRTFSKTSPPLLKYRGSVFIFPKPRPLHILFDGWTLPGKEDYQGKHLRMTFSFAVVATIMSASASKFVAICHSWIASRCCQRALATSLCPGPHVRGMSAQQVRLQHFQALSVCFVQQARDYIEPQLIEIITRLPDRASRLGRRCHFEVR